MMAKRERERETLEIAAEEDSLRALFRMCVASQYSKENIGNNCRGQPPTKSSFYSFTKEQCSL